MNHYRFGGICRQLGGKVKVHWGVITHRPAMVLAGKNDQLEGRNQERYGISKEQSERQLKEFLDRNSDWDPSKQ
jgi:uncharacterized protein YjbJ (UPF0337 family)